MLVQDLGDTARWVALYRAQESERRDALFHDPHARRLAGETNADIERLRAKGGRSMAWSIVVRTAVIDELIMTCLREHAIDTVLMLGAGLDARPQRLPLPASLRWHEVDLPHVIEAKQRLMQGVPSRCVLTREGLDLADAAARRALLDRLAAPAQRALVVCEGLLVYLPPRLVLELAHDLAAHAAFRCWITDMVSPALLRMMLKSVGVTYTDGPDARYFGPCEGTAFFQPAGWREVRFRSSLTDAVRLQRAPAMIRCAEVASRWLPGAARLARIGGSVQLERVALPGP